MKSFFCYQIIKGLNLGIVRAFNTNTNHFLKIYYSLTMIVKVRQIAARLSIYKRYLVRSQWLIQLLFDQVLT